jgi:hypothetical protein
MNFLMVALAVIVGILSISPKTFDRTMENIFEENGARHVMLKSVLRNATVELRNKHLDHALMNNKG